MVAAKWALPRPAAPTILGAHALFLPGLLALFAFAWLVVHETGGTKFAHLHIVYVPIILAAFGWNVAGGLLAGVVGTLLMGPLMPLDVDIGAPQPLLNWLSRGVYLVAFGVLIGWLNQVVIDRRRDLARMTTYDPGTDLPLVSALRQAVGEAVRREPERDHVLANILVDNAEALQSDFGAEMFEELMQECARRLRHALPESYYLARGGQTRFLSFCNDGDESAVRDACARVVRDFEQPVAVGGVPMLVEIEIGLAFYPEHGEDVDEIVRASFAALVSRRSKARHVHIFHPPTDARHRKNLQTLSELAAGIARGELQFHAQPKMRLSDERCVGAELLVRWRHPSRGLVPPAEFIPLAEQSRLISTIGAESLAAARNYLTQAGEIANRPGFRLAVNVSAEDISDPAFPDRLSRIFDGDATLLNKLEIEVTETAIIADVEEAIPVLKALRDLGVHISIDDFGTGHSSLRYLKDIPADTVKIDQSFVRGILESDRDQMLLKRCISLIKDLGFECVAEGVESASEARWLHDNDCDLLQGYWYSRPLAPENWQEWLRGQTGRTYAPPGLLAHGGAAE